MASDLPKAYAPQEHEEATYARWEESGFFDPDRLPGKRTEPYCIVMPPPNVTGTLHLGHAVMLALEDILIRFARMRGKRALWIPGTDHAAIATQTKVERLLLEEEKKSRHDLGREAFLARVRAFAQRSHDTIVSQVKRMGSSCDWSREAYTLDDTRSAAVAEAFTRLHDLGLLYRGTRVVNWCPRCASTLADDEVEYREGKTTLCTFRYDASFPFAIATTRPETKLGDTGVAVHPDDKRYKAYVGKELAADFCGVPLALRVVADRAVDPAFGTGALGVTPAHSKEDERIAEANGLRSAAVIGEDGRMTAAAGRFAGKPVAEARAAIVAELRQRGLLEKEEEVPQNLSVCYRCGTPIEPLPKLQWFLAVSKPFAFRNSARHPVEDAGGGERVTLKDLMRLVVQSGQIQIVPDRFVKTYLHWIDNLRDWNISRQIWFGHRVPVWYGKEGKGEGKEGEDVVVSQASPGPGYAQDEDTLDTWFSSGLWTFSTLGWPAPKAKDYLAYHPTAVLETGYDILFFWVARMVLMSLALTGEIPFRTVYLHGLVRDEQGRKMSKSLGNVIDPLDMSAKYGTDAVRLSLVIGTTPGNDTRLSEEKIAGFRNFTNKLWNIGRYVLTTTTTVRISNLQAPKPQTLPDRWILARLAAVADAVTAHLERFEFSAAGQALREFTWGDFADWYLEIAKAQKAARTSAARAVPGEAHGASGGPGTTGPDSTDAILRHALRTLLVLWHPFMPFVTEALWKELGDKEPLIIAAWPTVKKKGKGKEEGDVLARMRALQDVVVAIRDIRAAYKVPPKTRTAAFLAGAPEGSAAELPWMGRLADAELALETPKDAARLARAVAAGAEIFVDVAGGADTAEERARLAKEAADLERYLAALDAKLADAAFTANAPPAVVRKEREKRAAAAAELEKLREQTETLG